MSRQSSGGAGDGWGRAIRRGCHTRVISGEGALALAAAAVLAALTAGDAARAQVVVSGPCNEHVAQTENPGTTSSRSGDFMSTWTDDGLAQSFFSAGAIGNTWQLPVSGGVTRELFLQAWAVGAPFTYSYSYDGVGFTTMFSVSGGSDDGTYRRFDLPSGFDGTVHVRGASHFGQAFVDHLFIRTDEDCGAPPGCVASSPFLGAIPNPAPGPAQSDAFGRGVALSATRFLVGAWRDDTGAVNAGSAYLYDLATRSLTRTFGKPAPEAEDLFGRGVALTETHALIGAEGHDDPATDSGGAWLFDPASGALLRTFTNPRSDAGDAFGTGVALSTTRALIGAPHTELGALANVGAAYLFDLSTGALTATLANPDPLENESFGEAVALTDAHALVGAFSDDTGAISAGSAYLFDAATGALLRTFNNPTPAAADQMAFAVALNDTHALLGAPFDDFLAVDSGVAHLFNLATGALEFTFLNPAPSSEDRFGFALDMTGSHALIGAFKEAVGGNRAGAAYLYDLATRARILAYPNPFPQTDDNFGVACALTESNVLIGASLDDTAGFDSGSAYLYGLGEICPTTTPTPAPSASPTSTPFPPPTLTPNPSPTVMPTSSATPTPPTCCPGDADRSGGAVNAADFLSVQQNFGADNGSGGQGDADCSGGAVNAGDFLQVQSSFGLNCD